MQRVCANLAGRIFGIGTVQHEAGNRAMAQAAANDPSTVVHAGVRCRNPAVLKNHRILDTRMGVGTLRRRG